MNFEFLAESILETISGGIDWNQVGMQALYGGASGAGIGAATGIAAIPMAIGGAALGGGLAMWSTWDQPTRRSK